MYIIMLGAQGTGKGTVAGEISKKMNWPHISTGDIFRKNISEKTELGIMAEKFIAKGELVPDDITIPMIIDRLNIDDAKNGAILDGFPRTIKQAEKLDDILNKKGKKVDMVINLITPEEELIDRMLTRRVCTNQECKATYNIKLKPPKIDGICDKCGSILKQREDDSNIKAIKTRLDIYKEKTSPLIEYYKHKGILKDEEISISINRMGKEVALDIIKNIEEGI